jgi:hypothetical protein
MSECKRCGDEFTHVNTDNLCGGCVAKQVSEAIVPFADFAGLVEDLLSKGYARNLCRAHCPDRGHVDHAHLLTPHGEDVMVWASGHASYFDLTQPAKLIYPGGRKPKR